MFLTYTHSNKSIQYSSDFDSASNIHGAYIVEEWNGSDDENGLDGECVNTWNLIDSEWVKDA